MRKKKGVGSIITQITESIGDPESVLGPRIELETLDGGCALRFHEAHSLLKKDVDEVVFEPEKMCRVDPRDPLLVSKMNDFQAAFAAQSLIEEVDNVLFVKIASSLIVVAAEYETSINCVHVEQIVGSYFYYPIVSRTRVEAGRSLTTIVESKVTELEVKPRPKPKYKTLDLL